MPIGPGKYDSLCTLVREQAQANAAIVIVLNGVLGSGFSVQAGDHPIGAKLPEILETIAEEIRASLKAEIRATLKG